MKKVLAFFFAAATILTTNAQVFTGNLSLDTQADVDAFNYTSVTGVLIIGGVNSGITNIDGLSELTSVGGSLLLNRTSITNVNSLSNLTSVGAAIPTSISLSIVDQIYLTNLDGLANLQYVGNLRIEKNRLLENINGLANISSTPRSVIIKENGVLDNLDGLTGITTVAQDVEIGENPLLTSIQGLSNLIYVGEALKIADNESLTNLDGLTGLHNPIGDIIISSNDVLTDIAGLSNLESPNADVIIQFNRSLANIDGLSNLTTVKGSLEIVGNIVLVSILGLSNLTTVDGDLKINVNSYIAGPVTGLPNLDGLSKLTSVGMNLQVTGNKDLFDFCGLYNLFHSGTVGGTIEMLRNGANTIAATAPADVTVNADQGVCTAVILDAAIGEATPVGCLEAFTIGHTDFPAGNVFLLGATQITWSITDGAGNTATAIQTITVVDNQNPVITSVPANVTVSCAADVPAADVSLVTATDNCSVVVTHDGDVTTNKTCDNRFTLTRTYKATDAALNSVTATQVITVYDGVAPQISGLNASPSALWPPNHKMQLITIDYDVTDNCLASGSISVLSSDPDNGTGDGDTDNDVVKIDDHSYSLRAERASNGDGRIYTITVTADDGCNAPVEATTQVIVAHNIVAPKSGQAFKLGSTVSLQGSFWDKPGNKHTAQWLIDNTTAKATVTEPSGFKNGTVNGSYKFTAPGVYKLQMNVKDQNGLVSYANTNGDLEAIVVIYDPNGGYAFGGGWFASPAGALKENPGATGKVSFGFSGNYFKNATYPKGETQLGFKVGDFEFNALNFDYLAINNAMAQFKGTGKIIGGQSGIGFIMTVTDGQLDGSGEDKIRMKIYNKNTGAVIYDNQAGAGDAVLPLTVVGSNSVITIRGNGINAARIATGELVTEGETITGLQIKAQPNPARDYFSLSVKSNNTKEKIMLQVFDQYGRMVDVKNNITASSLIRFGEAYRPGAYYVRVIQGSQHKELTLVKLTD